MGYFLDTLRALGTTLRTAFRKPTTVEYPKVERPRGERYRASFALLHDEHGEQLCIGCLMCERICPSRVIAIRQGPKSESKVTGKKRGWAEDLTLDLNACIYCELCVQVCPEDAIVMTKVPEAPSFAREGLVLTMDALYANENGKPRSWGTGSRLMAMQAAPDAKPKAAAKPAAKPAAAPVAARPAAGVTQASAKPADAVPQASAKPADAAPEASAAKPAQAPAAARPRAVNEAGAAAATVSEGAETAVRASAAGDRT